MRQAILIFRISRLSFIKSSCLVIAFNHKNVNTGSFHFFVHHITTFFNNTSISHSAKKKIATHDLKITPSHTISNHDLLLCIFNAIFSYLNWTKTNKIGFDGRTRFIPIHHVLNVAKHS